MAQRTRTKPCQRGSVAVELAVTAPLLILLLLGLVEFGRAMMALHALEESARAACRIAILDGTTSENVSQMVSASLQPSGISNYELTISPADFANASKWEPVTVTVKARFDNLSWLPVPQFLGSKQLVGSCTLPRESGQD